MRSSRDDYKTMQELYEGHLKRESDYLEKKGGNLEETLKEDDNKPEKEEKKSILDYVLMPFILVYYVLIGIPSKGYSLKTERVHFISGLLKVITYIYVFYNISNVSKLILEMGFSETFKTIFMGVFTIFSIFQFCIGLFTANYTFTGGESNTPDVVTVGGYRTSSSRNLPVVASEEPYDKTMKYMNAKMTGMSNSKREKYLSDFYGGKLNDKRRR